MTLAPADDAVFAPVDASKAELGRMLFFDKILSGNRNISCATCHHPLTDTGDGLSLGVGEGGRGLGQTRDTGSGDDAVPERVPRNAPALFNLGAREFRVMFHDGRVEQEADEPGGFRSPAGAQLPDGLDSALAAQAMFPVTSSTEMAGQPGENRVANAAAYDRLAGEYGVWDLLARRLRGIPEYVSLFDAAFEDVGGAEEITFVHAANAIAAFESRAWRADESPFDRFRRGDPGAMSDGAHRGIVLFHGEAGCASCHGGVFQTDHAFHAMAMPQIGPGKGDGPDGNDDFGRERVTGDPADRYRFRTPSLRNVVLTGPWGHDGAYDTLEAVVTHMLDPVASLESYDRRRAMLPPRGDLGRVDWRVMDDPGRRVAIGNACEQDPRWLTDSQIDDLITFLHALTDPASLNPSVDVPRRVPSGLPVAD